MKLIFLGTSGYHPSDRRHTSCLVIPESGVVLDAGTGMYRLGNFLQGDELDIFLSHAHLDHVVGLSFLFSINWQHPLKRITVRGQAEKLAAVEEHLFSKDLSVRPPFDVQPLQEITPLPHNGRLTYFPLTHVGGSVGYRLDWPGHSLAYVTDTTADEAADYVEKIRGVDLLVHECYFSDEHADLAVKYGHSCASVVAQVAKKAQVGRLILTHIHPLAPLDKPLDISSIQKIFPNTALGEDLMEVEF